MSSNLEPMKRGLTQWLPKGNNHALLPDLMESVPSRKALEIEELRAQYALIALQIRANSDPQKKIGETISKTSKGLWERCKWVLRNAFIYEPLEKGWEPPSIDHAMSILKLAQDSRLREAASAWKELLGRMEASGQRMVIFTQEREAALRAIDGSENARYRKNEQLRAYENLRQSEDIVNTSAANLNKDALELLQRIGEVLEKLIPVPSESDK